MSSLFFLALSTSLFVLFDELVEDVEEVRLFCLLLEGIMGDLPFSPPPLSGDLDLDRRRLFAEVDPSSFS